MSLTNIPSRFNLFLFIFSQTSSRKSSFPQALSPEAEIILPIFQNANLQKMGIYKKWKFTKNGNLQKKKNNKKRKFTKTAYEFGIRNGVGGWA